MKIIFISDLHLSAATPEHNQVLFELLQQWQGNIDALYILGDFFDSWVGDDDENPFIHSIKSRLKAFSSITPLYFRGGNHDFAVGKLFARQTGIKLLGDMHCLQVAGNTLLLSHGDTFCTLDLGYQRLKKILQNPLVIFILRHLPLWLRYKLKERLEHKSGSLSNSKPQHIYHVVAETVIKYALAANANIVIHGHTHNPGSYRLVTQSGTVIQRFEIPDWQDHPPGGYLVLENQQIKVILAQT